MNLRLADGVPYNVAHRLQNRSYCGMRRHWNSRSWLSPNFILPTFYRAPSRRGGWWNKLHQWHYWMAVCMYYRAVIKAGILDKRPY